jgi:hypothetical protein
MTCCAEHPAAALRSEEGYVSEEQAHQQARVGGEGKRSWGPILFTITLALLLLFFWWLLIYSGGVSPHHG